MEKIRIDLSFFPRRGTRVGTSEEDEEKRLLGEFMKLNAIKMGDLISVGAKRLATGIYLGIREEFARRHTFIQTEQPEPCVYILDIEFGPVSVPLFDVHFIEIISRASDGLD